MDRQSRKRGTPRQYRTIEKAVVVADAATLGFRGDGRLHGVPERMRRGWLRRKESFTVAAAA